MAIWHCFCCCIVWKIAKRLGNSLLWFWTYFLSCCFRHPHPIRLKSSRQRCGNHFVLAPLTYFVLIRFLSIYLRAFHFICWRALPVFLVNLIWFRFDLFSVGLLYWFKALQICLSHFTLCWGEGSRELYMVWWCDVYNLFGDNSVALGNNLCQNSGRYLAK